MSASTTNKKIQEVLERIHDNKLKRKDLNTQISDALGQSKAWTDNAATLKELRAKQKELETTLLKDHSDVVESLEKLAQTIEDDQTLVSDLALNAYVKGQDVEIMDKETGIKWEPKIKVTYSRQLSFDL